MENETGQNHGSLRDITWQDLFVVKAPRQRRPTVKISIQKNCATIEWRPRFIFYDRTSLIEKNRIECGELYDTALSSVLAGALRWDLSCKYNPQSVTVNGISGTFKVEIYDKNEKIYDPADNLSYYNFHADSRRDANIEVVQGGKTSAIVWDAFFWRADKKLRINISLKRPIYAAFLTRLTEHEFGHVLGLFDAYGYAKKRGQPDSRYHYGGHPWPPGMLPPAPIDGKHIKPNSVMVCDYLAKHHEFPDTCEFARTGLDYEMILHAFTKNKLQLYINSLLGRKSQAATNLIDKA